MTKASDKQKEVKDEKTKEVISVNVTKRPGIVIEQNRAWRIKMGIQEA